MWRGREGVMVMVPVSAVVEECSSIQQPIALRHVHVWQRKTHSLPCEAEEEVPVGECVI